MELAELVSGIPEADIQGDAGIDIEGIEYDSRRIRPGNLFVAIRGFAQDGYDFVDSALANGAVAVLGARERLENDAAVHVTVPDDRAALAEVSAKFYGYPGLKLKACGVTGTNGKTTTCHIIRRILQARQKTTGLITSTVYDSGSESFPAERTTPESLDLQRLLFLMKQNRCVNAVVEVSSHALILHRVDHIDFRVAVYTNLTRDHLDFHGSMENYLEAKKLLLKRLEGPLSYAVLNYDVPEFRELIADVTTAYITYSLDDSKADVHCRSYRLEPHGTDMELATPMGASQARLRLPGRFNLTNAVAAAAAGLACGVDIDNVIRGLEAAEPVPGRFEPLTQGQPFGVFVDFAHTPDALVRLCESARGMTEGRLLLLFGCGGDRDKGKRPLMGEAATKNADFVMVTADNPRSEAPENIIEEVKPGLHGDSYEIEPDRRAAIERLINMAEPGDTVLLAGKGAEEYFEVKGERLPFSDRQEVRRVLTALGYSPETSDLES